ncbi:MULTISPECIES: rhodanese-like domain-containing protein [Leeia]|uniref:Sulfurtransferase n=1 Tax=Leeia aquatica TaxID=2725557 RepID=A0A847SCQ4_9NEIS|nr:rhodanese-like domain-containing protein [Leeia aquatica]NLR76637.1 sulfurtransferase [Leeia aquatica]
MHTLTAQQLQHWLADPSRPQPQLIDVREPWEVALCQIPGSVNLPMHEISNRLNEVNDGELVTICHHGMRSYQVALFLENAGLGPVHNLTGGVEAWATQVDPDMARY